MSENPDLAGSSNLLVVDKKPTSANKRKEIKSNNFIVFVATLALVILASSLTFIYVLVPTLFPLQLFLFGMIILGAGISSLIFLLFQRLEAANYNLQKLSRPDDLSASLNEKISDLENKNRNLKRFYQEERQRALVASNAKTAFLAHLSHNFRTPLTHIIGFADMVAHQTYGPIGDQRYLTYINDIKKSGEGLLATVSNVLDLADLVKGHHVYCAEDISVQDLFKSIKTRFGLRAERIGLSLKIDPYCTAVLSGDRISYERLLECLVDNSLKFTPAGGQIKLAAWEADDGVVLEVTDSGIGIDKSRLEKLAQPFVHEEASISQNQIGMGLGLSIAKSIAELSGGEMAIDSSPTLGTTVVVTLPFVAPVTATQSQVA